MTIITRSIDSPIGALLLVGDGERLHGLYMTNHRPAPVFDGATADDDAFAEPARQLDEWFAGRRTAFDLPTEARGTPFQHRVWDVLLEIPFGRTMSYGEVATRAGRPGSARAVGHAVGRNPLSIVVACHRVVGRDGKLTGYAGGLERKRFLLELEQPTLW